MKYEYSLFLENYTLSMSVGIYEHERKIKQNVIASVEILVNSIIKKDDFSSVYNYELFKSTLDTLSATHYDLLEDFASDIANKLFEDSRVLKIKVKLIKEGIVSTNSRIGVDIIFTR